jgi:hypothetical protein
LLVYLVEIPSFSSDGRAIVSGAESMVGFLPNSGRYIGGSGESIHEVDVILKFSVMVDFEKKYFKTLST